MTDSNGYTCPVCSKQISHRNVFKLHLQHCRKQPSGQVNEAVSNSSRGSAFRRVSSLKRRRADDSSKTHKVTTEGSSCSKGKKTQSRREVSRDQTETERVSAFRTYIRTDEKKGNAMDAQKMTIHRKTESPPSTNRLGNTPKEAPKTSPVSFSVESMLNSSVTTSSSSDSSQITSHNAIGAKAYLSDQWKPHIPFIPTTSSHLPRAMDPYNHFSSLCYHPPSIYPLIRFHGLFPSHFNGDTPRPSDSYLPMKVPSPSLLKLHPSNLPRFPVSRPDGDVSKMWELNHNHLLQPGSPAYSPLNTEAHQYSSYNQTYPSKSKRGHLCIYCGKLYSRKYGLKIHLRTHTGYKPLKCKVCLRPFGDPSNLNKHIRLHAEGDTPYRCEHCGKVLVRRRDLERHIRSRHPNEVPKQDETKLKEIGDLTNNPKFSQESTDGTCDVGDMKQTKIAKLTETDV